MPIFDTFKKMIHSVITNELRDLIFLTRSRYEIEDGGNKVLEKYGMSPKTDGPKNTPDMISDTTEG